MNNLVDIKFHGELGEILKKDYKLAVSSVKEALHAVNRLSGKKLSKYFIQSDNFHKCYRILVNGKDIVGPCKKLDTPEKISQSEFIVKRSNIKTIDIIPVIQGSGDFMDFLIIVVAVALLVFAPGGIAVLGTKISATAAVVAGLGLVAAGLSNLLSSPPEFEEFQDNSKTGKRSFVFDGPVNVVGEGRAVPFGYGRMRIGSQAIDATYEITYADANTNPLTT
jgi:predicted phage tail protein